MDNNVDGTIDFAAYYFFEENDLIYKEDMGGDGTMDFASYSSFNEHGDKVKLQKDEGCDGFIDELTSATYIYGANGYIKKQRIDIDIKNDGTVDEYHCYTNDINGNMMDEKKYSGDNRLYYARYCTYTYISDGNVSFIEREDGDGDGRIDKIGYHTFFSGLIVRIGGCRWTGVAINGDF